MDSLRRIEPAPISGLSHIQLAVDDVSASERWWTAALGLERLAADETIGYVALRHRPTNVLIVLSSRSEDSNGPGDRLDHVAFAVDDRESLEAWADRLTAAGIDHPGIVLELGNPSLQLQDPDGINLELVTRPD